MGWLTKASDILKTAKDVSGILSAFKVPGAKSVSEAVDKIFSDAGRSNDDAVALLAATVDVQQKQIAAQEKRIVLLEKALKVQRV